MIKSSKHDTTLASIVRNAHGEYDIRVNEDEMNENTLLHKQAIIECARVLEMSIRELYPKQTQETSDGE